MLCLEDMHEEYDAYANDVLGDGWDVLNVAHEHDVKGSMDATNVDVTEFVERVQLAPVERPTEERTGDVYGLHDPFPAGDMGLDGCDYSGSSFTGSEMTNDQDEDFYKDSKGRRPEAVFAFASVSLEEVAEKQRARVAAGRPENDSSGDESSRQSSEDEISEDEISEDENSDEGAAKRPRTDGN